ncbi:MAG: hypothetical protein OXH09_08225 [Gammaproteobacteria bacterium]|nr:hypothetical protein [Gammaproteobacteria bacterium]
MVFTAGQFRDVWQQRGGERNTLFSFRSSYRYNTEVRVAEIRSVGDIGRNEDGASTAIAMDSKMESMRELPTNPSSESGISELSESISPCSQ